MESAREHRAMRLIVGLALLVIYLIGSSVPR